jgi:hypothetical protein
VRARSPHAPIVVIGAHRSGTTLLIRMLEALGVFTGASRDANEEALFFLRFNEWLLQRCGASWDHPDPVRQLFTSAQAADARALAQVCASRMIRSPRTLSYLGWRRFLRQRRLDRLTYPWGWKDPRTTFTLPLWLQCFPDAKIVHVIRHGVDVAQSLTERHVAALASERLRTRSRPLRYLLAPYRKRYFDTVACCSLEGSFGVWERYAREARRQVACAEGRAIELRFEDLVTNPARELGGLVRFCGIDTTSSALQAAAGNALAGRAYAFERDARLRHFADGVGDRLREHGYAPHP